MQAANQFTPEQLILAGRRAEAQGQSAYAMQFYRYVADNYPQTTEAYEARDALFRLAPPAEQPVTTRPPATAYRHPSAAVQQAYQQPPAPPAAPAQASLGHVRPQAETTPEQAPRSAKAARRSAEPVDDTPVRPVRGYRIGRLVGAMLNTIGWLCLVSAVAMIPLMIAALTVRSMPRGLRESIAGNLVVVGGGTFGLLVIGLFAVFAAQVARATFDSADAVRALYDANSVE